jgi:hypothetical protein
MLLSTHIQLFTVHPVLQSHIIAQSAHDAHVILTITALRSYSPTQTCATLAGKMPYGGSGRSC